MQYVPIIIVKGYQYDNRLRGLSIFNRNPSILEFAFLGPRIPVAEYPSFLFFSGDEVKKRSPCY